MPHQIGHMPDKNTSMQKLLDYNQKLKNFIDQNQDATLVSSDQTNNFINTQNKQNMGASQTNVSMDFDKMGTLGTFMKPAMAIMDQVYQDIGEPTQREKDINMGRMFLKFFTKLGAGSSVPGQTAFGAANIAGAEVAQDYINSETKKESDKKKLAQAKKSGALTLATQLKSADEAKKIAELKAKNVKPGKPNQYKILNVAEVSKKIKLPSLNPMTGEAYKKGDIIELTPSEFGLVPRGNLISYKEASPPKPNTFERLRNDVMNVVTKYIDNDTLTINPAEATTFGTSLFQLQKDTFKEIEGEDGETSMVVIPGLDMISILRQTYGVEKTNNLLERMGIDRGDDKTPITDQVKENNKNIKDEKEIENVNGDVTEYNVIKVGNKKIRVLSKKKDKMSKELVVSLNNAKGALKDLDMAVSIFFPGGKYNKNIAYTTSLFGKLATGDARTAYQSIRRAIEVILRLRTGAAAPETEVQSYLSQFMPNFLDSSLDAEMKFNALIDFFEGVTKGINEGRRTDDKTWVRRPNANYLKDIVRDGGELNGRKIKFIKNKPYIQKEKGSDEYVPIK